MLRSGGDLGAAELQRGMLEAVTDFSEGYFLDDVTLVTVVASGGE